MEAGRALLSDWPVPPGEGAAVSAWRDAATSVAPDLPKRFAGLENDSLTRPRRGGRRGGSEAADSFKLELLLLLLSSSSLTGEGEEPDPRPRPLPLPVTSATLGRGAEQGAWPNSSHVPPGLGVRPQRGWRRQRNTPVMLPLPPFSPASSLHTPPDSIKKRNWQLDDCYDPVTMI